ncbi:hypothetical protein [Saccharomonospora piscinae]|uniref:hypothetical protein n=1 Tax=Saccharomonospora piscinae TaxID=687388 RepID=UPI0004661976|nr:hypothetical protein [Saccharomonospora piscinae]
MRTSAVRAVCTAVVLSGFVLAGCDEVNSAVEGVESAGDKAAVCTEALQIIDINPNVSPEDVAARAEEKANELRELGNQVADQTVQDTLFDMANGYLELEERKLDHMNNFSGWLERNLQHLDELRQACF